MTQKKQPKYKTRFAHLPDSLKEQLSKCNSIEDLFGKEGTIRNLVGDMVNFMLDKEMENHLGYEKYGNSGTTENSRNGSTVKTARSSFGEIDITTPRDRNSEFEPQLVKKYQRDISLFDEKILSMYAKGMTTRDISDHIQDLYGVSLSAESVSNITDKTSHKISEWQARVLATTYAIVYFDAIHYKVRENGHVITKAAYTCLGINMEGRKEIIGIWIGENEGAKFWLNICTELKNRGVKDILIACIDGLKGLPDAIKSVFPDVEIQLCIIHMIRNSFKYIPEKHSRKFMADLKKIYRAPSEIEALAELDNFESIWLSQYPLAVKPWRNNWDNLFIFLKFPDPIRKMIYTTNAVEGIHRQFRKVTKNRSMFPNDESLLKILFLAADDISKKWTMPIHNWKSILAQLTIYFEGRIV